MAVELGLGSDPSVLLDRIFFHGSLMTLFCRSKRNIGKAGTGRGGP